MQIPTPLEPCLGVSGPNADSTILLLLFYKKGQFLWSALCNVYDESDDSLFGRLTSEDTIIDD